MNDLLEMAVRAHGGPERWNKFETLHANMAVRGAIFEFKHIAGHQEDAALAFESRQPRTRRAASSRRLP